VLGHRHADGYGEVGHGSVLSSMKRTLRAPPLVPVISVQDWLAADVNPPLETV
jgi:hypothetical protein